MAQEYRNLQILNRAHASPFDRDRTRHCLTAENRFAPIQWSKSAARRDLWRRSGIGDCAGHRSLLADEQVALLPSPDFLEFGQRLFKFAIEEPHRIKNFAKVADVLTLSARPKAKTLLFRRYPMILGSEIL